MSRGRIDPRYYQIAVLSGLLVYGMGRLSFEISSSRAILILLTALVAQLAATNIFELPGFDPRSALISSLSLCLLLRTGSPGLAALAAVLAIAGKFLVRWNGKHVFNPTNFAIIAVMLISRKAWVSPGQWGNAAIFAFFLACVGGLVVFRSERSDVTAAFLLFHLLFLFGRSLRLGEPLSIPLHRLENGALLIFAFFMISDPKTTPDSRAGRLLFAFLVAAGAWFVQFRLFRTNGLLWSLAASAFLVPVLDRLLPGSRYEWIRKGAQDETPRPRPGPGPLRPRTA
jgi:Na+-transporting NADH:ubiquinone oxidoreductase subunit NqrB